MLERLRILIGKFGEKEDVLIIGLFMLLFFILASIIKQKKNSLIFSIVSGFFITMQIVSLYFTNSFIGYQFFIHANIRGTQNIYSLFISQIVFSIIFLFLLIFIFYKSNAFFFERITSLFQKKISQNNIKNSVLVLALIIFCIILNLGDFVTDTKSLASIFQTKNTSFNKVLEKNGMTDYVYNNNIIAEKGNNIIVISLESLEKAYLTDKFSQLTPNLQNLKKKWNYYNLQQNFGSGWTSGSLYTCLTGFPSLFGLDGNSIFDKVYDSKISGITHALNKAGYYSTYMNGNADYSGVKEMAGVFGFKKIIDYKSAKSVGEESVYGLRDKDLFYLAKKEVDDRLSSNDPFFLFISTTDTHFPNGIYDKRMESHISKKNSDLEFMIAATDFLVGDFISYLESKNLLKNTTVYIFPDHLKMGDPTILENTGERGLYLISNSNDLEQLGSETKINYQIDLPKIILKGANVKHNLKFLTDYISGNKEDYLKNNILSITEINTSGMLRHNSSVISKDKQYKNDWYYRKDTLRYIAHAGGKINGETYTNSKEALNHNYEKGFRLFELDIIKTKNGKYVAAHDWKHWASITKYQGELPPSTEDFINSKIYAKYTPLDIDLINEWFLNHDDAILITDKVNDPVKFSEEFIDPSRLIMELFDMEALQAGLKTNIKSAMPSQSIIDNIKKDDIKNLAEIGVKNIAISRRFIQNNKELLLEFKRFNIKPYAYHINFDSGFDEEYVTKYEMDYIYGIYADDWSFK